MPLWSITKGMFPTWGKSLCNLRWMNSSLQLVSQTSNKIDFIVVSYTFFLEFFYPNRVYFPLCLIECNKSIMPKDYSYHQLMFYKDESVHVNCCHMSTSFEHNQLPWAAKMELRVVNWCSSKTYVLFQWMFKMYVLLTQCSVYAHSFSEFSKPLSSISNVSLALSTRLRYSLSPKLDFISFADPELQKFLNMCSVNILFRGRDDKSGVATTCFLNTTYQLAPESCKPDQCFYCSKVLFFSD